MSRHPVESHTAKDNQQDYSRNAKDNEKEVHSVPPNRATMNAIQTNAMLNTLSNSIDVM